MKRRALGLLCVLAFAGGGVAHAQQLPSIPSSLSLEEAIGLATDYNPTYRQTANDRSAAAWGVRNAFANWLPSFNSSASFGYSGAGTRQFGTADFVQPSSTVSSSYNFNLSWTLNGTTFMAPGVQKAQLNATNATIEAARMTVRNSVVQQYLAVLEAEAQVRIQQQQVARNEENRRLAQARFDVGQTTLLDVTQAEVAKGQSDVALLQANQLVTVERLRLFQNLGLPAPEDPSIVALSDTFPITEPDFQLGNLIDQAMMDNPDVLSLRAQSVSAGRNENSVKSQWLPSATVSASWNGFTQSFTDDAFLVEQGRQGAANAIASCETQNVIFANSGLPTSDCTGLAFTPEQEAAILAANDDFPFAYRRAPFGASLTIRLPIFDQFNRNVQVAQASAQSDDAREAVRARELQVRTDVTNLYYALQAAYQTIQIQENNRSAGQEQLRLAREQYRVGSGTFFDLLDAQVVAQQAEADYVTAVYAYQRQLANLEAAVGRPMR